MGVLFSVALSRHRQMLCLLPYLEVEIVDHVFSSYGCFPN